MAGLFGLSGEVKFHTHKKSQIDRPGIQDTVYDFQWKTNYGNVVDATICIVMSFYGLC